MRTWGDIIGEETANKYTKAAFMTACINDFKFFCENVLGLIIAPFHQEWIDLINQYRKLCILAARQHGKTEVLGVAYPLWFALRAEKIMESFNEKGFVRRDVRVLIVSGSLPQSTRSLRKIRLTIEQNEMLKEVLMSTSRYEDWSKTSIYTKTGCHIVSLPFSSTILGETVDLLIPDDLLRQEEAILDISIEKFNDIISPIYEFYNAQVGMIGTPMFSDDLYSQIEEAGTFYFKKYPACKVADDGSLYDPLWPELYPIEKLEDKRAEIGPVAFARQYLLDPMRAGESLFPQNLIESCIDKKIIPLRTRRAGNYEYFLGVDIAMSKAKRADFTVFAIVEKDRKENRYRLVYLDRHKGWTGKMIYDEVVRLHLVFNFELVNVEEKGLSLDIVQRLQDANQSPTTYLRTRGYQTGARGQKKDVLVTHLQTAMMQGVFSMYPERVLAQELFQFGIKRKRVGTNIKETLEAMSGHDDTVIATALAFDAASNQYTSKVSMSFI